MKFRSIFPGPRIAFGPPVQEPAYRNSTFATWGLYAIDEDGLCWALGDDQRLPSRSQPVWFKLDERASPICHVTAEP